MKTNKLELDNFNFFKKIKKVKELHPKIITSIRLAAAIGASIMAGSFYLTNIALSEYNSEKIKQNHKEIDKNYYIIDHANDETISLGFSIALNNIINQRSLDNHYEIHSLAYQIAYKSNISLKIKEEILEDTYNTIFAESGTEEINCIKNKTCHIKGLRQSSAKKQPGGYQEYFNNGKEMALRNTLELKLMLPIIDAISHLKNSTDNEIICDFEKLLTLNTKLHYNELTISQIEYAVIDINSNKNYSKTNKLKTKELFINYLKNLPNTNTLPDTIKNLSCSDKASCDYLENINQNIKYLKSSNIIDYYLLNLDKMINIKD